MPREAPKGDRWEEHYRVEWVQEFYSAPIGAVSTDEPSPLTDDPLEEVEPEEYYKSIGHDGRPLPAPQDLDEALCRYRDIVSTDREKFDRAMYWLDRANREWEQSMSSSFAALVSAIESLIARGTGHSFTCPVCNEESTHETAGAVRKFKDFLEAYARGNELGRRRDDMYSLRSGILHGRELITLDQGVHSIWDAPWLKEHTLYDELSGITRIALRNWLRERSG